ncbi:MAG: TIGR03936 family radical SAM-associated protein [Candidatus Aquicultor sp.]
MKVLIKYGKSGPLKYLSHLELIRALERSFRRAGVEVQVSGGFSPRPKVSHGPALSVGVASSAEYLQAELVYPVPEDELIKKITSALPEGLSIYRAKYIRDKKPSITSAVQSAAYRVKAEFDVDSVDIASLIEQIRGQERLLVRHKGKEKWVKTNVAILDWKIVHESGNEHEFHILISVGDSDSTRPELIAGKLSEISPDIEGFKITEVNRIEQYVNRENPLIDIYNFYESVKMGSERDKS